MGGGGSSYAAREALHCEKKGQSISKAAATPARRKNMAQEKNGGHPKGITLLGKMSITGQNGTMWWGPKKERGGSEEGEVRPKCKWIEGTKEQRGLSVHSGALGPCERDLNSRKKNIGLKGHGAGIVRVSSLRRVYD